MIKPHTVYRWHPDSDEDRRILTAACRDCVQYRALVVPSCTYTAREVASLVTELRRMNQTPNVRESIAILDNALAQFSAAEAAGMA